MHGCETQVKQILIKFKP